MRIIQSQKIPTIVRRRITCAAQSWDNTRTEYMFDYYSMRLESLLTPLECRVFQKLSTPQKIQDYLDTLPINFEISGETCMSPRRVLRERTAHCFEGAVFAAAALAYHGKKPLLMDLKAIPADEDHVVAPFRESGR